MALAPNGDVFVTETSPIASRCCAADNRSSSRAVSTSRSASHSTMNFSTSAIPTASFVSLTRMGRRRGRHHSDDDHDVVASGGGHVLRNLVFSRRWIEDLRQRRINAQCLAGIGSDARDDPRDESRTAAAKRIFASGLRNPSGLAIEPVTGALWTAVNERDMPRRRPRPRLRDPRPGRRVLRLAVRVPGQHVDPRRQSSAPISWRKPSSPTSCCRRTPRPSASPSTRRDVPRRLRTATRSSRCTARGTARNAPATK